MFVRVWEYKVPGDRVAAFTAAYAADGAWGELFGRAAGFLGTELYRAADIGLGGQALTGYRRAATAPGSSEASRPRSGTIHDNFLLRCQGPRFL